MEDTEVQRFKFAIPILKTSVKIVKDKDGNDVEEKYVEGIASGTELDKHGDRMAPSAIESMAKSLKQHVINLNVEHDTSWSGELGDITKLAVSEANDLEIVAKLNKMSSASDLWYALTEQNKKLGLSIGGYVKDYAMVKEGEGEEAKWVRVYKDIELDHIAVTSRPAYPKAWVSVISKSIESDADNKLILKKEMEEIQKPYPNEHSCRLQSPGKYDTCRRGTRSHNGKQYSVIFCKKTGGKMEEQAYRYNKETWSASEAGSHCRAHGGTFEAARSGKKSLCEETICEENEEKSKQSQDEKKLRELARKIVKRIQEMEADLLLELTFTGLHFCDEALLSIIERSLSMTKKDVSLEAEEAKKKADASVEPEDEKDETEAAPENESKEETTPVEEPEKEGEEAEEAPAAPATEPVEEKPAEEEPAESEPAEEEPETEPESEESAEKAVPKEGDACTLPDGSKGHVKGGKCVADTGKSEESSGEEEGEDEKKGEGEAESTAPAEGESEKSDDEKPADKTEDKSAEQAAELLKSIQGLTDGMKKILETNEALAKRVAELEEQPASRKTIELKKGVGDDGEPVDEKSLKEEMEEKIAEARKSNYGSPNLFAIIQKIRAEYSKKIAGQV